MSNTAVQGIKSGTAILRAVECSGVSLVGHSRLCFPDSTCYLIGDTFINIKHKNVYLKKEYNTIIIGLIESCSPL